MKKFYDCSINKISNVRHNDSNLGPLENDIMADLNKYSLSYGFERVDDYKKADIIITNTIYPRDILEWSSKYQIPRMKRMDGIYWMCDVVHKNEALNIAAEQSDHIIFISNYSKNALQSLYPNLNIDYNKTSVILNNVDELFFNDTNINGGHDNFNWCTSATNWNRVDKRLSAVIELSKLLGINDKIFLIGKCDYVLPNNIIKMGYINDKETMGTIMSSCDAFFSPFFRCAGSKVTTQAIKCGLPVLHSSTGGLPELVDGYGVPIDDGDEINFLNEPPTLPSSDIKVGYDVFLNNYDLIKKGKQDVKPYYETMKSYFNVMDDLITR